jgi:TP901 family phage tail tape measure protein
MADAQKTIDLIFNGIDRTGAATLAALDNARKFSGSVKDITQPVADFTMGAAKLEAGMLAAGVAMTLFAAKTAGDFEQSFAQISTLFDASADDVARFKDDIQAYASTSGKSMQDITGAINAAIGSGVDYSKAIGLVGDAEKLAIATRADLKGTTEVLVSTLNAYGLSTEQSGRVSDIFFQTIKDGKIEMGDLAHSFAMVSPLAATAGVSLEEISAAVATLTASGIAPSTAIEYLRSAITNIIKPSEQAAKMAAELGIEFDANALKSKGLAGVLDDVAKATKGNSGQMAKLIGDVGGLVGAMVLTGPQAEKFKQIIENMSHSAGSTAAAYEKMANSMEVVKQRLENAFIGMATAIGTPLLEEFGGIANAVAKVFTALGVSVKEGGLKDLETYIESIFGQLQKTIETVAANLPAALEKADFSGFKNGIEAVVGAFSKLFSSIDLSTVDGLTRAIELAGAAFLGLSKFTAGIVESFKPLFDKLVDIGSKVAGLGPDFFEMAGNIGGVVTQFNLLSGGITNMLPYIDTLVGLLVAKQGLSLLSGIASITMALPEMTAALTTAGLAMAAYFASDKVVQLVQALVQWKQANDHLNDSQKQTGDINQRAAASLERFAETTGIVVKSINEADKLITTGAVVWSDAVNGWVKASDALAGVGASAKEVVNPFKIANDAVQENAHYSEIAEGFTKKLTTSQKDLTASSGETAKSIKNIADAAAKAEAAQKKWNEEVFKMQFEANLKLIEAQSKIATAQIEADAKKAVAAYESLGITIKGTSDVLSSLFGQVKDFNKMDWSSIRSIEAQIDKENAARDKALQLQERLTNATVRQMEAQTNAMIKGDGLIKITGDGLEPHLEAFMWTILQKVQTRVNKDGLKLLLGM